MYPRSTPLLFKRDMAQKEFRSGRPNMSEAVRGIPAYVGWLGFWQRGSNCHDLPGRRRSRLKGIARLTPPVHTAPQKPNPLHPEPPQPKSPQCARGFTGTAAIQDHLSVSWDELVIPTKALWLHTNRARDRPRIDQDILRYAQVHHKWRKIGTFLWPREHLLQGKRCDT